MHLTILVAVVWSVACAAAQGCLNDSDTKRDEEEFRGHYAAAAPPATAAEPESEPIAGLVAAVVGAAAAGAAFTAWGSRSAPLARARRQGHFRELRPGNRRLDAGGGQ